MTYEDYNDLSKRRYINGRIVITRDRPNQEWSYGIFNKEDDEKFIETLQHIEKYNQKYNKTIEIKTIYEGKIYIMGSAHKFLFESI